jgi:hypothetical protein
MTLQFFDDVADETHDARLTASGEIAKSFCRQPGACIDLNVNGG